MRLNAHTKPLYDAQIGDRRGDPLFGLLEFPAGVLRGSLRVF